MRDRAPLYSTAEIKEDCKFCKSRKDRSGIMVDYCINPNLVEEFNKSRVIPFCSVCKYFSNEKKRKKQRKSKTAKIKEISK